MESIKEKVHEDFVKLRADRDGYFDKFYTNNYNLVYRICFSILKDKENSEDVVQTVFEKIYKLPDEKIASMYESSWLYTVAKNEAIQFLRTKKYNLPIDEQLYDIQDQTNKINEIEENEQYRNLVKKLDKKQEQIVSLKILSDFTFKEIGEILSMPTATVQWYYYKSIRFLRLAIGNLAMFVISLSVGIIYLRKNKEKVNLSSINDEKLEINESDNINNGEAPEEYYINKANRMIESLNSEFKTDESTSAYSMESSTSNFNMPLLVFSIAGITLVTSIIFTVLCLKHKRKK